MASSMDFLGYTSDESRGLKGPKSAETEEIWDKAESKQTREMWQAGGL